MFRHKVLDQNVERDHSLYHTLRALLLRNEYNFHENFLVELFYDI